MSYSKVMKYGNIKTDTSVLKNAKMIFYKCRQKEIN